MFRTRNDRLFGRLAVCSAALVVVLVLLLVVTCSESEKPTEGPPAGPILEAVSPPVVTCTDTSACALAVSTQGHTLEYRFDWKDGSPISEWSTENCRNHDINPTAPCCAIAQARCATHTNIVSAWSVCTSSTLDGNWTANVTITVTHPGEFGPYQNFQDIITLSVNFTVGGGAVAGTGTGSHAVTFTPGPDCIESSIVAPGFPVALTGTATGGALEFVIIPMGMMSVTYVVTCDPGQDDEIDYTYPQMGFLESSIMSQCIDYVLTPVSGTATTTGSGTEPSGGDIPLEYSYSITIQKQ